METIIFENKTLNIWRNHRSVILQCEDCFCIYDMESGNFQYYKMYKVNDRIIKVYFGDGIHANVEIETLNSIILNDKKRKNFSLFTRFVNGTF